MIRAEALEIFRTEEAAYIENARTSFAEHLMNNLGMLKETVMTGIEALKQVVQEKNKKDLVFFYFSLIKTDVMSRNYRVSLLAQDAGWYLDQNSIEVTFSLDLLFEPLNELWDYLATKSKEYVGKVNSYDVKHIILEELDIYNESIAHVLRFLVRDLEQEPCFLEVPKAEIWEIHWGEFRHETQLLLRVDRTPKTQKDWKREWHKVDQKPDRLVFSYWHQGVFSHADCTGFDLKYISFEQCNLSDFNFDQADLLSAKFPRTTLKQCSFKGSCLQDVDFTETIFEQVDFTDANLTNAVFLAESVPELNLTPEQLDVILVPREE